MELLEIMERLAFPDQAKEVFKQADAILYGNEAFQQLTADFMGDRDTDSILAELDSIAAGLSMHQYTLHFMLLLHSAKLLWQCYQQKGIPEWVYWDTIQDLRAKLDECIEIHGVPGTFVAWWQRAIFQMKIFGLGRLEYELSTFPFDQSGTVKQGDRVLSIHIPSGKPLTPALVDDSLQKAAAFFQFNPTVFVCDSWLLYPEHDNFLPEGNILAFKQRFKILLAREAETFEDSWRVFGHDYKKPIEELPEKTALQCAYKAHLLKGGKTGTGYGILR